MNHSKQILWHIILISLMNAMTYIYAEFTFIWLHTPLFCKILFAIIYGTLQLSLLFHTIKASSKLIYFFPFYWLLGIFRILCRAFSRGGAGINTGFGASGRMITAVKSVRRAFGRPCLLNWRMKTGSSVCSGKRITICMNSRSRRAIR